MDGFPIVLEETLSDEQLMDLRKAFSAMDMDESGLVYCKDIPAVFSRLDDLNRGLAIEGEELLRYLEQLEIDIAGQLSFQQFLTLIAFKINTNVTVEELIEAFRMFDRNDSGFISFDDLWRVMQTLGENLTKKDIEEMMREADQDGDGKINFAEFVEMIRFQDQSNQSNEENKVEQ